MSTNEDIKILGGRGIPELSENNTRSASNTSYGGKKVHRKNLHALHFGVAACRDVLPGHIFARKVQKRNNIKVRIMRKG